MLGLMSISGNQFILPTTQCWDAEPFVVLLMVLAGVLILGLVYWVLSLRHRLRVAQAGNALEYFGFYHMARYDLPVVSPHLVAEPPSAPLPPHITLSPVNHLPSPIFSSSRLIPRPPHGACWDTEMYSQIGLLQPSGPSGVSHSRVVLFEHSAL